MRMMMNETVVGVGIIRQWSTSRGVGGKGGRTGEKGTPHKSPIVYEGFFPPKSCRALSAAQSSFRKRAL